MRISSALLVAFTLLAVAATSAVAVLEPQGDRIQASNRADELYFDGNPVVGFPSVATGGGNTLVVWEDNRVDGNQIWGQFLSGGGVPVGADFQISEGGADDAKAPAVAYDSARSEFLVVWESEKDDVWGQRVHLGAAGGEQVGDNFAISTARPSVRDFVRDPDLAFDATAGAFLVVWQDVRVGTFAVMGRRVLSGGAAAGEDFAVSRAHEVRAGAAAVAPAIDHDPIGGQFVVVWGDARADRKKAGGGTLYELFGQRIAPDGAALGANFHLEPPAAAGGDSVPPLANTGGARSIDVAADSARGGFLAVMSTDMQGKDGTPLTRDVHGIHVSSSGVLRPTTVSDLSRSPSDDYGYDSASSVQLAFSPVGRQWLAIWYSGQADPKAYQSAEITETKLEIMGQLLDVTGDPEGPCTRPMKNPCESNDTLEVGGEDFRISRMSDPATYGASHPDAYADRDAFFPAVAFQPGGDSFGVVWAGDGIAQPFTKPKSGQVAAVTDDWYEAYLQILEGPEARGVSTPTGGGGGGAGPGGTGSTSAAALLAEIKALLKELLVDRAGKSVPVPVSCPAEQAALTCEGSITGETVEKVTARAAAVTKKKAARIKLGSVRYSVPRGATAEVRLPLKKAAAALRRRGKLKIQLRIDGGALGRSVRVVTVYASPRSVVANRAGALRVRVSVPAAAKAGSAKATLRQGATLVAQTAAKAAPGGTAVVALKLTGAVRSKLLSKRRLKFTLRVVAADAAGRELADERPLTVRLR